MYIKQVKTIVGLLFMVSLTSALSYAGDQETPDELLNEALLDDDFELEFLVEEDLIAAQNKPLKLSVQHLVAVDPQVSYQRTHHTTDIRLSSETPMGLLGYAEVELKALQYWQGDAHKPPSRDLSVLEVERLVLQYSLAKISIKFGRYLLNWGEVEGAGVLDVINPAPNLTDIDAVYTPQWLLNGSYYMPAAQASWFVGLKPSVAKVPQMQLSSNVTQEWGGRYSHTGAASDWAVYAGHMVPNKPVLDLATATASAQAYQLLGYSWNKARNNALFKFDIAYKRGLEHNLGYTGLKSDQRLDMALGLELKQGERQWDASLVVQHWLNYQANYLTPAVPPVASNEADMSYSLGVKDSFNNANYNWSLVHLGTPSGSLRMVTGELSWAPVDPWKTSLSYTTTMAQSNTLYALINSNQRLTLKTKFSY